METIAHRGGVTFVNDTCATTPDATIAAINAMDGRDIVLIAGGTDKELVFEKWATCVTNGVRAVVLLPGSATTKMRQALKRGGSSTFTIAASSMREAVRQARKRAKKGSVILLSPGAASFGLFQHEFDRGDAFARAVSEVE